MIKETAKVSFAFQYRWPSPNSEPFDWLQVLYAYAQDSFKHLTRRQLHFTREIIISTGIDFSLRVKNLIRRVQLTIFRVSIFCSTRRIEIFTRMVTASTFCHTVVFVTPGVQGFHGLLKSYLIKFCSNIAKTSSQMNFQHS